MVCATTTCLWLKTTYSPFILILLAITMYSLSEVIFHQANLYKELRLSIYFELQSLHNILETYWSYDIYNGLYKLGTYTFFYLVVISLLFFILFYMSVFSIEMFLGVYIILVSGFSWSISYLRERISFSHTHTHTSTLINYFNLYKNKYGYYLSYKSYVHVAWIFSFLLLETFIYLNEAVQRRKKNYHFNEDIILSIDTNIL